MRESSTVLPFDGVGNLSEGTSKRSRHLDLPAREGGRPHDCLPRTPVEPSGNVGGYAGVPSSAPAVKIPRDERCVIEPMSVEDDNAILVRENNLTRTAVVENLTSGVGIALSRKELRLGGVRLDH